MNKWDQLFETLDYLRANERKMGKFALDWYSCYNVCFGAGLGRVT